MHSVLFTKKHCVLSLSSNKHVESIKKKKEEYFIQNIQDTCVHRCSVKDSLLISQLACLSVYVWQACCSVRCNSFVCFCYLDSDIYFYFPWIVSTTSKQNQFRIKGSKETSQKQLPVCLGVSRRLRGSVSCCSPCSVALHLISFLSQLNYSSALICPNSVLHTRATKWEWHTHFIGRSEQLELCLFFVGVKVVFFSFKDIKN